MTTKSRGVEVKLQGHKIPLKIKQNDELAGQVLKLVQKTITEAESKMPRGVPHQVAVIALLDLAESYLRAKRKVEDYRDNIENKSKALFDVIEETLP